MAESYLDMIFRTKKEGNANKEVAGELNDINAKGKNAASAFEMLTGSSLSAAGAFGAVAGALKFSIGAAMEAESIQADLNATITSTKGAAGMSAEAINGLAASLSEMSGIEDDSIVKAQAMMLTFTNIGKEVFPMASEAMVNMASKFGSVDAAAMQLGKALNDPIAGVGALRRVGVQLTDQQEASIKSFMALGDVASAQKVILGELQTEFGGLAAAMGGTTEGSINKLKNSLGNLAETVGGKLLPYLKGAADALNVLLTADDKVKAALEEHDGVILKTTKTYAEYRAEKIRSAQAAGTLVDKEGNLFQTIEGGMGPVTNITGQLKMATRAEWEAAQGGDVLTESLGRSKKALEDFKPASDNSILTYAALRAALSDTTLSIEDQERALSDNTAAVNGNIAANALNEQQLSSLVTQYGSLSAAQIYNQLASGMSREEAIKLGETMGLIDPSIMAARDAMDALNQKYAVGQRDSAAYRGEAEQLAAAIARLKDKSITITTFYNSIGQGTTPAPSQEEINRQHNSQNHGETPSNIPAPTSYGGTIDRGAATGADFIVPPGYPNDTYRLGVSSDEHVIVNTPGKSSGINIGTVVLGNSMDMEVFKRMLVEAMGH
jgi:hypothetical protein